jgi:adenylate kinase family enzyme
MKRILIIGSSGAGKSTFARRLHKTSNIKLVHLDQLFWKPNWVESSKDEWRKTVEQIVKGDEWIMDGNYSATLEPRIEACDTIIFLDLPPAVCVYRILKRVAFYKKGSRPDMAEGCDERFDFSFLRWVWDYPNRTKPKVEALLEKHRSGKTVFHLKSNKEVESFFVNFEKNKVRF